MRAAAILGLGCSAKDLAPFQSDKNIEWRMGMPASADEADVILLFGGDGTIHRHLGQLVRLRLPVLVVPAGSGNDFARALGLRRVQDSLAAWEKFSGGAGNARTIDLGIITPCPSADGAGVSSDGSEIPTLRQAQGGLSAKSGQKWGTRDASFPAVQVSGYFCCVAGIGLDAEVAKRANELPRWLRGHGGYVLSLAPTVFRFAALPMKIRTAEKLGKDWKLRSDQPTILAAFANAPLYGGGMKIAPQAKMDDGLLDVCVIGGVNPLKLFCMFPTVYFGKHLSIREVEYFHAACLRVETEYPLDVYADGEYVCRTPVEVGVQSAALQVIAT